MAKRESSPCTLLPNSHKQAGRWNWILSYFVQTEKTSKWKPISLKWPFLVAVIILSLILLGLIQSLLIQSAHNSGLLFADNINALPIRETFTYLYLPTIISVVYGFFWTWIDLDVRRLEPYYQASYTNGATGNQSLLLHYPVDFVASVPIKALKFGHWPVFFASVATVFTVWGIIPAQSGIFAIEFVNRTFEVPMARSTQLLSLETQQNTLSAQAAQSVSSIMWLNETLQPFMTRDFVLAPFGPSMTSGLDSNEEIWLGNTTLYSVNVTCEPALPSHNYVNETITNNTWGCSFVMPPPRTVPCSNSSKIYDTLYVGYSNYDGSADYYLSDGSCPPNASQTFYAQWSKALIPGPQFNSLSALQQPQNANVTSRWCQSSYYTQSVLATVAVPNMQVLDYVVLGSAESLSTDLFNVTDFEASMSMGHQDNDLRTGFPSMSFPNQDSFLLDSLLNLDYLPKMAPFAIGANQLPFDDYLDPDALDESYQSAYRLLFARQMSNVLSSQLDSGSTSTGRRQYTTQAIVVVPPFAYVVEALLGMDAIFALVLLMSSLRRKVNLMSDPATVSALMSISANDMSLLRKLGLLERYDSKSLDETLEACRFALTQESDNETTLKLVDGVKLRLIPQRPLNAKSNPLEDRVAGVRPLEFKWKTGLVFFVIQAFLFIFMPALFWLVTRNDGLNLPSDNSFIRQLLENYLPIAIGTFIEPFWLILNRHLCLLQPFESLRKGSKKAMDSVGLDYSSLPPQFVVWKALRRGHFLLSMICAMTLLANLLSVALNGIFFEGQVQGTNSIKYAQPYVLHFVALNGSGEPFIQDRGGTMEPFYVATSNVTANTPMPPWTDDEFFYLPFTPPQTSKNDTWGYRAITPAFGAILNCMPLDYSTVLQLNGPNYYDLDVPGVSPSANLTVPIKREDGTTLGCVPRLNNQNMGNFDISGSFSGLGAFEFNTALDGNIHFTSAADNTTCEQHIAAGWVRAVVVQGTAPSADDELPPFNISSFNATVFTCFPTLVVGNADVIVNSNGHVQQRLSFNPSNEPIELLFTTNSTDLIGQAHQFVIDRGLTWHQDDLPSDFMNYLMANIYNDTSYYNTSLPPPSAETAIPRFSALYSKLFSIVIGRNMDRLLVTNSDNTTSIEGTILRSETRIFMSIPFFIIAESIIGLYIIATIALYSLRPWKILPRMPDTPASVIAYFAASNAVRGFAGMPAMSSRQREKWLEGRGERYGFGTFIGTDDRVHVGIEKHPYLAPLTRESSGLSWQSGSKVRNEDDKICGRKGWTGPRWRSGKIREGGWI